MPDIRAMRALSGAVTESWAAVREAFALPFTARPDEWTFPPDEECAEPQVAALTRWRAATAAVDAARARTSGWRY